MNSLQLISKLRTRVRDLEDSINQIFADGNDLTSIEKSVLKKNCSELYELILRLEISEEVIIAEKPKEQIFVSENEFVSEPSIEIKEEIKENSEPKEISFKELIEKSNPEEETIETLEKKTIEAINEEIVVPENKITEIIEPVVDEIVLKLSEVAIPQKENEAKVEPKILQPQMFPSQSPVVQQVKEPRLSEKIGQNLQQNKLVEPKIDNLKTAISLNKKIAFVNILFRENVVEYAKSIDRINSSANLDDALGIFKEIKSNQGWLNDNELVKELENLIVKRFS